MTEMLFNTSPSAKLQALPQRVDLDFYHQDNVAITIRIKQMVYDAAEYRNRQAIDITGWGLAARWKPNKDDPRSVDWDTSVRDDLRGEFVLQITPAMFTEMMDICMSGYWDLEITYPDLTIQTYLAGYVYTIKDVTDA